MSRYFSEDRRPSQERSDENLSRIVHAANVEVGQPGEIAKLRRHLSKEIDAGEVEIDQALERPQERWHGYTRSSKVVPAEIKVLQTPQGKQGGAYLSTHGVRVVRSNLALIIPVESVVEVELDDMASPVAAPDAVPPAAVSCTVP